MRRWEATDDDSERYWYTSAGAEFADPSDCNFVPISLGRDGGNDSEVPTLALVEEDGVLKYTYTGYIESSSSHDPCFEFNFAGTCAY